jgi:phosphoribosyl 1,2-cyclic phosphodiesterase
VAAQTEFFVRFWGVRGGHPLPGPTTVRVGGNTLCTEVRLNAQIVIIDTGTGAIQLGRELLAEHERTQKPIQAVILYTHLHHDHTQGLPFFSPGRLASSTFYIFGPVLLTETMEQVLSEAMLPPLFPITLDELPAMRFVRTIRDGETIILREPGVAPQVLHPYRYDLGDFADVPKVTVLQSPSHPRGGVLVYCVEGFGRKVVLATDTEGYPGGDRRLIRFSQGADILIHDAEWTEEEYLHLEGGRQGWGHSTWQMAVEVAQAAGVKKLYLYHHDPWHDDDFLEEIERQAQEIFPNTLLAREGMVVEP